MKKRIGVFLGDFFWSSIPYDGLVLYSYLKKEYDVDLIIFEDDIRLNKKFNGEEKFYFDVTKFTQCEDLVTVEDWDDFYNLTENYSIVLTTSRIAPKTRFPRGRKLSKCPIGVWDIGGCDILPDATQFSDFYFVKGNIWKDWLIQLGKPKDKIFITGSPHYDYYAYDVGLSFANPIQSEDFCEKYSLNNFKKRLLVLPTNPASHPQQFDENIPILEKMVDLCKQHDYEIVLKTYPNDYVFYENEKQYSGIYKRRRFSIPQYQELKNRFDDLVVIESQDHFSAIQNCDLIFNMQGSHVAWETYFTDSKAFACNYKTKSYYRTVSFLPETMILPDEFVNYHIDGEDLGVIFNTEFDVDKYKCSSYFLKEFSLPNISRFLKVIVN